MEKVVDDLFRMWTHNSFSVTVLLSEKSMEVGLGFGDGDGVYVTSLSVLTAESRLFLFTVKGSMATAVW